MDQRQEKREQQRSQKMVSKEEFEELRAKLIAYEQQQNESQQTNKDEVRIQVDSVAVGFRELYAQASSAVTKLDTRVEKSEAKGTGGGQKSLLHYKNMTISVLEKMDQWRSWKSDIEDYTEETLRQVSEGIWRRPRRAKKRLRNWSLTTRLGK